MQAIINTTKQVGLLTIALILALAANFAYGQWADPADTPPGGNVAVPINVSADRQNKVGDIEAGKQLAGDRMQSDLYCNYDGTICATVDQLLGGGPSGPACTTIPAETIEVWGSCRNGGGSAASCPAGYTSSNHKHGFQGSGSYNGDCVGSTRSGDSDYTMYSRVCTRSEQNYCDTSTCQTYPEFSFSRTDVCGGSASNLGCPAGYDRVRAATGTCNRDGESRTRYTVTCTLPAQTYCAS